MQTQLVILNDQNWFDSQKIAGQCVAKCLKTFKNLIESHKLNINLLDIEAQCVDIIKEFDCTPTFYKYKTQGSNLEFPGKVCLSVNKQLVHGIPVDYILQEGDVISLDLGATHKDQGIADAAITCLYGKPKKFDHQLMLDVCYKALMKGIESIQIGKQIGCIGFAIHKYTKSYNFGLITEYGGHGIGLINGKSVVHAQPFVANKGRPDEGVRIQPGLTIAIEPQLVYGGTRTKKAEDGWTVMSLDGVSAHWEHSIYIAEDKVHIMTDWENYV
jgi:methionyl aminopeptidase